MLPNPASPLVSLPYCLLYCCTCLQWLVNASLRKGCSLIDLFIICPGGCLLWISVVGLLYVNLIWPSPFLCYCSEQSICLLVYSIVIIFYNFIKKLYLTMFYIYIHGCHYYIECCHCYIDDCHCYITVCLVSVRLILFILDSTPSWIPLANLMVVCLFEHSHTSH